MRKKLFRRVVSVTLAGLMAIMPAFSDFSGAITAKAATATQTATADLATATDYGLVDNVQDGVILHCWNWSFNNIAANMEKIAAAGYSAVQTSPIQAAKEGTTNKSVGGNWWVYYQPAGFWIDNSGSSAMGNKADFTAMCAKAKEYGVKVIVDVVANHVGNKSKNDFADTVDPEIKNDSSMVHTVTENSNYSTRYENTQKCICVCPDLNTGNSKIQNKVLSFLKECIDCGADGFRFDAAKHIETPDDESSFASQFWPTVINGATSYYKEKTGNKLYCYGEILDNLASSGSSPSVTAYTKYMSVTANDSSNNLMKSVANGNATGASSNNISLADSASHAVLWAESHDTWANDDGYLSRGYETSKVQKAWAMVGSRRDAAALYFVRPTRNTISTGTQIKNSSDATSVKLGAAPDTGWNDKQVAEVNHFHNYFVGASEYLGSADGIAYNVRYNSSEGKYGVVLSNCSGTSKTLNNFSIPKMADGTYTDTVSGTSFTVSGGKLSGSIGSTGIAVVYNATVKPTATISQAGGNFKTDTLTLTLGLKNATSGTYAIGSAAAVKYTSDTTITIGSDMNYGDSVVITLLATDGDITSKAVPYTFTKVDPSAVFTAYAVKPSSWTGDIYCYAYDDSGAESINNGKWPGVKMTLDSATGYYVCKMPDTFSSAKVILYGGSDSMRYPESEQPGFEFTSTSMLFKDNAWTAYNPDPTPVNKGTVVVKYVDEAGKEIATSTKKTGTIGDAYSTTAATISGYKVKTTPENASGKFTEKEITVTYVYEKNGVVIVTGNVLYAEKPSGWDKIYCYAYDNTTDTTTKTENAKWPGVEMTLDAATNYYKCEIPESVKAPKVIVNNGNGQQFPAQGQSGYALNGAALYKDGAFSKYDPPVTTGNVIVKYVDEDGKDISASKTITGAIGEAYTTEAATVEGYELTATPANATGTYTAADITVTYTYKCTALTITSSLADGAEFDTETAKTTITLKNATSGTYKVDNGPVKTFTGSAEVVLGQGKIADSTVTLDVTATNGTDTKTATFKFVKKFNGKTTVETLSAASALVVATELATAGNAFASKYYSVNADGKGSNKTITSASDWTAADMIAQGVANDDSNVFKGPHEYPVYDEYALYAAYDDSNLYVGWQYVDVRDVTAPDQQGAGTTEAKPYNADIPQMLAFDLGSSKGAYTNGGMDTAAKDRVWGIDVGYTSKVNAIMCFSSKLTCGTPALFTTDSNGNLSYKKDYCRDFKSLGITGKYEDGIFAGISSLYGIKKNAYTGYTTDMLYSNDSEWTDLLGSHNTKLDTFYTMTIPYTALNIDKSYIESNGIGIMHISTYGASGIASIPADDSMYDNAMEAYSADASSTGEKEDSDIITASLARIGAGTSPVPGPDPDPEPEPTPDELVVNFGADKSAPQLNTTELTLKAIATGGTADYTYEFFVDGNSVQAASKTDTFTWSKAAIGTHVIKAVVTDAKGKSVTSQKIYTIEGNDDPNPPYVAPTVTSFATDVTSAKEGSTVTLTAAAKDGEGTLQYRFVAKDAKGNETVIKEYSEASTATWTPAIGTYSLTVTVKDAKSTASKTIDGFVVVAKDDPYVAPTVTSFTTDVTSAKEGDTVKLTVAAKDGEGALQYLFTATDANGKEILIRDYTEETVTEWTPAAGTYTIKVTVKDAKTKVTKAIEGFVVTAKEDPYVAPTVTSFTTDVTSAKEGDTVTLTAAAKDGEGTLQYLFTATDASGKEGVIRAYGDATATWTPTAGTYTIKVTVRDAKTTVIKTIENFVVAAKDDPNPPYVAPAVKTLTADVTGVKAGTNVTFTATATGSEELTYAFTIKDANGKTTALKNTGATATWTATVAGTYTVEVTVTDAKNGTASKTLKYTVIADDVPAINISGFGVSAATIAAGQSVTMAVEATGGAGTLKYQFVATDENGNAEIIRAYGSTVEAVWTPEEAGLYTLSVNVKDTNGTVATAEISSYLVTEEAAEDELTADSFKASIKSGIAEVGNAIKLTGKASGGEGELLYKIVCVYDDESIVLKEYSSKKSVKWTPAEAGIYNLFLYVTDEAGTEVSKSIKKYVVNEKPLAMTSFTANGLNAVTLGNSVKLKTASQGGVGTVKYKFTYKAITEAKSTVIKKYNKKASATWTPKTSGIYKLTAYAKDEEGTVVKQSFYFIVL